MTRPTFGTPVLTPEPTPCPLQFRLPLLPAADRQPEAILLSPGPVMATCTPESPIPPKALFTDALIPAQPAPTGQIPPFALELRNATTMTITGFLYPSG